MMTLSIEINAGESEARKSPICCKIKVMDKEALRQAMQQAQTMQVDLVRAQEELAKTIIEGHSNDGKVKVSMTANGDFQKVSIDPSSLADGLAKLERDILAALNDSTHKAAELTRTRLQEISGQIGL